MKRLMMLLLAIVAGQTAQAGVLNLPKYVAPEQFGMGIEPELTLTSGAGLGINARFQYGVGQMTNAHFWVGNGVGPRGFRVGGAISFDFFPDIEGQPGIGMAISGLYWRNAAGGRLDTTVIPYIQKTINSNDGAFTPYLAIPLGLAFTDAATYAAISQVAVGSAFKLSERFTYFIEVGVGMTNSETYLSTGLMIYP